MTCSGTASAGGTPSHADAHGLGGGQPVVTVVEAVTLIGAITAAVVAIMGAALQVFVAVQAVKTHTLVNGMTATGNAGARARGQAEGRLAQQLGIDTPAVTPPVEPDVTQQTTR